MGLISLSVTRRVSTLIAIGLCWAVWKLFTNYYPTSGWACRFLRKSGENQPWASLLVVQVIIQGRRGWVVDNFRTRFHNRNERRKATAKAISHRLPCWLLCPARGCDDRRSIGNDRSSPDGLSICPLAGWCVSHSAHPQYPC